MALGYEQSAQRQVVGASLPEVAGISCIIPTYSSDLC